MRFTIPQVVLALSLATNSFAASSIKDTRPANVEEDVLSSNPMEVGAGAPTQAQVETPSLDGSTTFNGIPVPPLKELDGDKFNDQAKEGYWYVLSKFPARDLCPSRFRKREIC